MLRLRKVAVTGGLASGKTMFCRYLKQLGAKVAEADQIVGHLLSPKTDLGKDIIALLGDDIVAGDQLNRRAIAQKVFQHPEQLKKLEQLLHPHVIQEIEKQYEEESAKTAGRAPLFVAEIPLLFEIHGEDKFDATVAITAPESLCKERYKDPQEYTIRMQRQLPQSVKNAKADYVIDNSGTLAELQEAAGKIFTLLTE